jgi:hypothetical protein
MHSNTAASGFFMSLPGFGQGLSKSSFVLFELFTAGFNFPARPIILDNLGEGKAPGQW